MKDLDKIFGLGAALFISFASYAQDYVAVAKDGNVYDDASAKYITVNQDNDNVNVIPGMVFQTFQHTPGWYKVEYSPGLHAFIPEQIVSSNFNKVTPGNYEIANYPGHSLMVQDDNGTWSAGVDGKTFKGTAVQDIIIFTDTNNNVVYSLVDLGNGPIAITYDNSVTKFF